MKLVYLVKIVFEDQIIVGLISPHLKVDFIDKYTDLVNTLSSTGTVTPVKKIEAKYLQMVIEDYVSWIQSNNYILRHPNNIQIEDFNLGEQWITIQLNTPVKVRTFEYSAGLAAPSIYLMNFALGEFTNILAARIHKISYTTLIFPIFLNFIMGGIFYIYSGASSSLVIIGRELDDWWYNSKTSPDEIHEIQLDKKHPFCSSLNLSKAILCTIVLSNVIFITVTNWQISMSLRDQLRESNINDPIITPKLIEVLAAINSVITFIYFEMLYTSFALKATHFLQTFFDNNYNLCSKWINNVRRKPYSEVLITEENTESEVDDIDVRTPGVITTSFNIISPTRGKVNGDEEDTAMFFVTDLVYDNLLLNVQGLLFEVKKIGGVKAVQNIINLGEDYEVASTIIGYIKQYGVKHVVNVLFGNVTPNHKIEVDLSCNQIVAIAEKKDTKNDSETFISLKTEEVVDQIIERNFFLNNEQRREFIQAVVNHFDKDTLLKILELGRDQELAEQILIEAGDQDANRVIATLLGSEMPVSGATDNLKNIIGTQELSKLQLVPNGVFNGWSNKAYLKIVEYIDDLAKNLDDLLNTGKSGSQVAVTLALLEEFLGFAGSGQRFLGGRPPYYNPGYNDDWSGSGGSSDGNNNSSAGNFDSHNEFVGLMLPAYNSTDYNDSNHQM